MNAAASTGIYEWPPRADLCRFATWLPFLSDGDRQYLRDRYEEVLDLCALDPRRPRWILKYYAWTLRAVGSQDPAAALAEAVASDRGPRAEVDRALAALRKTADAWEQRYRPASGIVGAPYLQDNEKENQ
jgi:hypothetical protein